MCLPIENSIRYLRNKKQEVSFEAFTAVMFQAEVFSVLMPLHPEDGDSMDF
jgi:hypothetical protein